MIWPTVASTRRDVRANLPRLGRSRRSWCADAARRSSPTGSFDRVVVDLPCSGTGTLRKHPELKWRLSPAEIGRSGGAGARPAATASRAAVRPGGLLVAITCSLEREENEEVAERLPA